MTTTEHPVRQLLWCALNALKTAQENHNITSETGLRHYPVSYTHLTLPTKLEV